MVETANTIWRDFVTDGVPASGANQPAKAAIRAWGTYLESVISAGTLSDAVWKATKANLDADLAHAADTIGVVYDDSTSSNNGLYKKSGSSGSGSWTQLTTFLPGYQFVTATDDGNSTANAWTMDTSPRLPSGDGVALVSLIVPATNTSATVTVSFDGGTALTVKTASGNDPAVGGLVEGMPLLGVLANGGTEFRTRSDQASAAVLAAAEAAAVAAQTAQAAAEAAAASVNLPPVGSGSAYKQLYVKGDETGFSIFNPAVLNVSLFGLTHEALVTAIATAALFNVPLRVDQDISFSAASRISLPSNLHVIVDAALTNTSASTSAGMFSVAPGSKNILITGKGSLNGPYTESEPVPAGGYPNANGCIAINGTADNYVSNVRIDGPLIKGWGMYGVFAECCDDLFVGGATRIEKCGRDGVRTYGCRRPKIGHGIHIENIHPGLSGNVYGVTFTRRSELANAIADADLALSTWDPVSVASVAASGTDFYGSPAYLMTEADGDSISPRIKKTFTGVSANQLATYSVLAKAGTRDEIRILVRDSVTTGNYISQYFSLAAGGSVGSGSLGGVASFTKADIKSLGGGWYRCRLVGQISNAGTEPVQMTLYTAEAGVSSTDGSGTIYLAGPQAIAGDKELPPYHLAAYPPTTDFEAIGGTVDGCYIWKAVDTHGGKRGIFDGWIIRNCATAVGISEGDTSGLNNCPPEDILIDNIVATRGTGSAGHAGINIVGSGPNEGERGVGVTVGANVTLDGFGGTNTGAIECSYFDGVKIENPTLRNSNRAGISFKDGPVQGSVRARIENLTNTVAAIAVETVKANLDLPGGVIRRTTGTMVAFSMVAQDAGYEVLVGNGWKMEGAVTRWLNANDVTDISRASPIHQRIHAAGWVEGGTGTGVGLYGCTTARTGTGVYTITFTTPLTNNDLARILIEVLGIDANFAQVTKTSTSVWTVNIYNDVAGAADNDFTFEVRAA